MRVVDFCTQADILINNETNLLEIPPEKRNVHCLLVDEAQFLQPKHIDQLRLITHVWKIPVICYGLRTDFRTNLFPGSQRLMELADTIEEVKTTCNFCNRKAVFNLKHVNGKADCSGPVVQLGAEEKYMPTCFSCYRQSLGEAGEPSLFGEEEFSGSEHGGLTDSMLTDGSEGSEGSEDDTIPCGVVAPASSASLGSP